MNMRSTLISSAQDYFAASLKRHQCNVEIMLNNPTAIHDHTGWMAAMETEIAHMAEYQDKIEILQQYFPHMPA